MHVHNIFGNVDHNDYLFLINVLQ